MTGQHGCCSCAQTSRVCIGLRLLVYDSINLNETAYILVHLRQNGRKSSLIVGPSVEHSSIEHFLFRRSRNGMPTLTGAALNRLIGNLVAHLAVATFTPKLLEIKIARDVNVISIMR